MTFNVPFRHKISKCRTIQRALSELDDKNEFQRGRRAGVELIMDILEEREGDDSRDLRRPFQGKHK